MILNKILSSYSIEWIVAIFDSERFWKIAPAIITAGMSYLVFRIGQKTITQREKTKEEIKLNDIKEYFKITLESFKNGLERQLLIFTEGADIIKIDLENKSTTNRDISKSIEVSTLQIYSFDKNDIFKIFISKSNIDRKERIIIFSKFYTYIELITSYNKQIDQVLQDYISESNKNSEIAGNCVTSIYNKIMESTTLSGNKSDVFHQAIAQINEKYLGIGDKSFDAVDHFLIQPIYKKCLEFTSHPDSVKFIILLHECNVAKAKILHSKKNLYISLNAWKPQYEIMLNLVEKMMKLEFSDFVD